MSTDQSQLDLNTLLWVKSEIDTTLKQARTALELHVESPGDNTQLKLVTNLLHQVRGTLQMVELYGAAMLAEELEYLASDIAEQKVEGRDDIYEVMIRAMWQLPDYLERLQAGYKDVPMVLLPLLNDIRAARRQPLLSESALFTPDLDVELPISSGGGNESLQSLAKKLRHTFHLGLLDWFRERDPKGGLQKLDSVIENLRKSANDPEVNRVLWSASGVLEALNQGGLETSVAVKLLMGQVDRQLKKIIDHGESALTKEPPAELEKNLLYYVASASSSGERVNELKDKFKLADALPDAETLEQAKVDLTGPNAELMQTVSTVLLDNLLQVKDGLDVIMRADEQDLSRLPALADELTQIADTLGMLGFGKQRQTIQEQSVILKAIAAGDKQLDESELMGIAQALLTVENLLQGNAVNAMDSSADLSMEMTAETQHHQIVETVMNEAKANLAKVKDALSLYIDMPRNTGLISDVPASLDQIRGGFEMLGMEKAAELIAGCRDYVNTSMIDAKRSQDPAQMDALADAISSIEYYMDSVSGQWGNPDAILSVAEERLAFIGVGVAAKTDDETGFTESDVEETVNDLLSTQDMMAHGDDTMIDISTSELGQADETADMMDIELSDMSTAELSLADFEKSLSGQPQDSSNETQEIDLSSAVLELDEPLELDLSSASVPQDTSNDTQDIDLSSMALELDEPLELDISSASVPQDTSNETQEIDLSSMALELDEPLELDLSSATVPQDTSNETQEIDLSSMALELDESIALDISENEAQLSENDGQNIDFDNTGLEADSSIDAFENIGNLDNQSLQNTSNETQEIEFDSAILEMDESLELASLNEPNDSLAEIDELVLEPVSDEVTSAKKLIPPVSTADIELQLAEWFDDADNKKFSRKLQKDIKLLKQFAKESGHDDASRIAKDMIAVIKAVQDDESALTDDIRNILRLANLTLTELFSADTLVTANEPLLVDDQEEAVMPAAKQEQAIVTSAAKQVYQPDDIDDEIIEIFIEEAREEHANICRLLPSWRSDSADEETLRELRRSFHTLKGSGRLVGASDLGEFAWAFENMLNRVIDKTVEPGSVMFDLLQQAADALPGLMEMFIAGDKPGQAIFSLMENAQALSQGAVVSSANLTQASADVESPEVITIEPDADESVADESLVESIAEDIGDAPVSNETLIMDMADHGDLAPVIDETLLDIYRKEVESHLESLHSYIEGWRDGIDRHANDKLIRAIHTLTGCSRTTAVSNLAVLFGEAEKYFKQLEITNSELSEDALRMLIACIDLAEHTIAALDRPGAALPDNQTLLSTIQSLHERAQAVVETEDESSISILQPITTKPQEIENSLPEYDEELLSIFIEEATEILDESDQTLHHWAADKQSLEHITVMQRLLHTLKGGARLAGLAEMGDLSHSLESMLEAIVDGQLEMSEQVYDVLIAAQDSLVTMLEQMKSQQALSAADNIISMVEQVLGKEPIESAIDEIEIEGMDAGLEFEAESELVDDSEELALVEEMEETQVNDNNALDNVVPMTSLTRLKKQQPLVTEKSLLPGERAPSRELVRVRSELLDNLVNFAGEVSIYRSRMEQQTNAFRYNLQELDDTVDRLREQLRKFEMEAEAQIQYRSEDSFSQANEDFDPLELDRFTQMQQLSRGMMESLNDLDSLRAILSGLTRESETLLVQQSRVNTELQEGLMRTRMVPFNSQANRLRRIVRQTSEELGKKAELHLTGDESEIDRTVLERMLPALEHMLRNAVAHGIETPDERKQVAKSEMGQINLDLSREGADIVLTLSDDGRGMDLAAIQQKAIEKGKLRADSHITREILFDIIMESGFSTADEVTQISGRGVGMDVVNNEIKQLGGLLKIDTEQGSGTCFTISLPLTLSLTRALMVQVSDETYALPLLSVEGVERISTDKLQELYDQDKPVYQWLGQDYPFMHLGSAMGISNPHVPTDRSRVPLLMVRSGEYRAVVQVDNLIGSREIVVKPVGPQLSTMRGIAGATIMGDGSVVLIIDLGVLVRASFMQDERAAQPVIAPIVTKQGVAQPVVMVVDDSITVRKVTTRLLERNDYRAISAKDGVDALAQLQEMQPDVLLLDVEMPRMDGFELATNMRNDERLRDIPIIMITSRTGQKHRDRAEKIGVNIYMGKPYGEGELLTNIKALLEQR